MSEFVHLHCHSEYSLLDGALRIKDLCRKARGFDLAAVAVTDHGVLHGAIHLCNEAAKHKLKPIIGCEVYVCPDHTDRSPETGKTRYHLVLLAQNLTGYRNLVKIVTLGALDGFYYKPRVDKGILSENSEGIIALSACLQGEIPVALRNGDTAEALLLCREYSSIFPERFFLEVQSNGLAEQEVLNHKLLELSRRSGLPLVGTNDCHYLEREDAEAHDLLLCVQNKARVSEAGRMRMGTDELYYKSPEEMEKAFAWAPEAFANAGRIAALCEDYSAELTPKGVYHFPRYDPPEGRSLDDEFRRAARAGLDKRLAGRSDDLKAEDYKGRLEMELEVISKMGYQGYFMIVQDFIAWAKNNGVPVGPGRGSAAGSLAAWALGITNLDPIAYNLLFERFLNPERKNLPDIDVDFCERKRPEVLKYINQRYGADSVAQITTFGTLKTRAVIKDVGRALGIDFEETNRLAGLVGEAEREIKRLNKSLPEDQHKKLNMSLAKELSPRLNELYQSSEPGSTIRRLVDIAERLEGLSRHASTHASAVVISDRPMVDYLPLYRGRHDELVTQYDMNNVEQIGLVKFDFLGLRTMTVLQDALDIIRDQGRPVPDLDSLPLDDQDAYRLYSSGDTDGIFQVESEGMRRYLRKLKPTHFEDIIAMIALYRPGPLEGGMVDYFIDCKHGVTKAEYPLRTLEECLKPTYGVIVYQEQAMQISRVAAGFTQGEADDLRKAMGKKKKELMLAQRDKFILGAKANGINDAKAADIFSLIEKFAGYGFNKSHSAAYALISYQTAYLKAHYPAEFMAALLSSENGNQDKLLKYVTACRDLGLAVGAPSVQESSDDFSVRGGSILFGLGGIKNVGSEASKEILDARGKDGPFLSLLDLCVRTNLRKVGRRPLEYLIKAGAMDCFGSSRKSMCETLERTLTQAQKKQKESLSGQLSMFSSLTPAPPLVSSGRGGDVPERGEEWPHEEKLHYEKEALGFFLSGHPLRPFQRLMRRLGLQPLEEARAGEPGAVFKTAVLVSDFVEKRTKAGRLMASCRMEDFTAAGECIFLGKVVDKARVLIQSVEAGAEVKKSLIVAEAAGAAEVCRQGAFWREGEFAFMPREHARQEAETGRALEDASPGPGKASFRPGVPFELTARLLVEREGDGTGGDRDFEEETEDESSRNIKVSCLALRPLLEAVRNDLDVWRVECGLDGFKEEHVDSLKRILRCHAAPSGEGAELNLFLYGEDKQCLMRFPAYRVKPGLELEEEFERWERGISATV
ncbi:MAG: DNA polymerase III subunit alpha [Deltaproteobacteria bacterium]|nr:DNA polymerase III subunit alpha [Deltaproteobacteria bacterium]